MEHLATLVLALAAQSAVVLTEELAPVSVVVLASAAQSAVVLTEELAPV